MKFLKPTLASLIVIFFSSIFSHDLSAQSRVDFEWVWISGPGLNEYPGELVLSDSGTIYTLVSRGSYGMQLQEISFTGQSKQQRYLRTEKNYPEKNLTKGADGNFYLTGAMDRPGEFGLGVIHEEGNDAFFVKYNQNGMQVWSRKIGGFGDDNGFSITADKEGNVLALGSFSSRADLDPGPDSFFLTTSTSYDRDFFVLKLDSGGNFLWVKQFKPTTAHSDVNYSSPTIQTDDSGNVYIAGAQHRGRIDVDPGLGVHKTDSFGQADFYICKLSPTGQFMWNRSFGGEEYDDIVDMVVNGDGDIYFTGSFQETLDFDPGSGVYELGRVGNHGNFFAAKLNRDGNFQWAHWSNANGNQSRGMGLALDDDNNLYLTGAAGSHFDFDPGPDTHLLKERGRKDIFVMKLTENGKFVWAKRMGAKKEENGNSIAVDAMNNVYVTGFIDEDSVDFDFGQNQVFRRGREVFVLKISQCNTDSIFHQSLCDSMVSPSGKYVWKKPGTYHDTVANTDGCDSILLFHLKKCPPVETSDIGDGKISIFPNPTSDRLTIDLGDRQNSVFVNIRSTDGRLVDALAYRDIEEINVDISHIPKGVYLLEVKDGMHLKEHFRIVKL